ncbi:AAA family ATPase [Streptomyces anulatus]|uniref:AAA family ATPase n=1 Tax=Streptomyces anulatus TaxID=1892 RepID=UPI001C25F1AC|nr:ATP-binding protein [Streptomyces anulatus]
MHLIGVQLVMVYICGVPGTAGKSEFARELARCLDAHLLSKAGLQRALFPADGLSLSPEKDAWLYEVLLKATAWNLDVEPTRTVVLDAQPAEHHAAAVPGLFRFSRAVGHDLHVIECVRDLSEGEYLLHRCRSAHVDGQLSQVALDRTHVVQMSEPPAASVEKALSLLMPRESERPPGAAEGRVVGPDRAAMADAF